MDNQDFWGTCTHCGGTGRLYDQIRLSHSKVRKVRYLVESGGHVVSAFSDRRRAEQKAEEIIKFMGSSRAAKVRRVEYRE